MPEKSHKRSEFPKMSAAIEARQMVISLGGARRWDATRESWLAGIARRVAMSPRRIRAIFYSEPIKLSADEYLAIERAWSEANASMASFSNLASKANLSADRGTSRQGDAPLDKGGPADAAPRTRPAASPRSR